MDNRNFSNDTILSALLASIPIGCSVTQRIKHVKQPRGGYIKPSNLTTIPFETSILNPQENVPPQLVGLVVDYLTRFMTNTSINEAFHISLEGAKRLGESQQALHLLQNITGLDDKSIINAVQLANYDNCYRAGISAYKPLTPFNFPNPETSENIRIMVTRSMDFLEKYGPKVLDGFTFEGGYTDTIATGDGDFLTSDTLWDFKVSKNPPTSQHTLQILIYWRMGLHSIHPEFQKISYLGIFNPRLGNIYRIATTNISDDIIKAVESEVIGY